MAVKKRSYEDFCAAAHALDLVGERWALLIVRELLLGPRRFTDLRSGLGAISPNVLTQRLNEMEAHGIIRRRRLHAPVNAWVYELTPWGRELEPIVLQIARWGVRSPAYERGRPVGNDSLVLSLKAMFLPERSRGWEADIGLLIECEDAGHDERACEPYRATITNQQLTISRAPLTEPFEKPVQASVRAKTPTLLALAYGGLDPLKGQQAGMLRYQGDINMLRRFFSAFALPPPAPDHTL